MSEIEKKLKQEVKTLFESGKIELLIGYENSSSPGKTKVCFIKDKNEIDKLAFNSFCTNNLAIYLPRYFKKNPHHKKKKMPGIGIVAKGCDARSVVGLIIENQIPEDKVTILGIPCQGILNQKKINKLIGNDELSEIKENGNQVEITTFKGQKQTLKKEDIMEDACLECSHPSLDCADIKIAGTAKDAITPDYMAVADFEKKSTEERWAYFSQELAKCIRCNACRQVCPNCYCTVCFIDQSKPEWAGKTDELSEIMLYHIGRIFHQAGRCVSCDACVRACPLDIDLRTFTLKMVKDVNELFDYIPGLSKEAELPLCTFKQDDSESFITAP